VESPVAQARQDGPLTKPIKLLETKAHEGDENNHCEQMFGDPPTPQEMMIPANGC